MALIKCPECGQEVSDKANVCPRCAFPISTLRTDGPVMIRIDNGLAGTVSIIEVETGLSLWTGRSGGVAEFNIKKPTLVCASWGLGKNKVNKDKNCQIVVEAGKKYELAWTQSAFSNSIILRRVDVIDSGR